MAVSSGFFNSQNGDRKYNAEQMSSIFDGIIVDGVYSTIGTCFKVTASTGNTVNVGIGRAWFNHAWIYNDAALPITLEDSDVLLNRYDAVVIEVNHSLDVRAGSIKVVKGTPSSSPKKPTLTKNDQVNQYPLCYILRVAESTSISSGNIENTVGTDECPYASSDVGGLTELINQKVNTSDVVNNLTTTTAGKVLDARQGKALNDKFGSYLPTSKVANNLTTTGSGYVLDARQGKTLNDKFGSYYKKTEIDSKLGGKLSTSGGTINGSLTMDYAQLYMSWNRAILWGNAGTIYCSSNQNMYLRASNEAKYCLHLGVHDSTWALNPDTNAMLDLGAPNHKWHEVYAQTGSIITSDRNLKNSIQAPDDRYDNLFMKLIPRTFKYNDGRSGRTHVGFVSQDVEEAMTEVGLSSLEFAGFCKDQKAVQVLVKEQIEEYDIDTEEIKIREVSHMEDQLVEGEYTYSLRYEEFIALNTMMIQKLIQRVNELEAKLNG